MPFASDQTAATEPGVTLVIEQEHRTAFRRLARGLVLLGLFALFGYAVWRAWAVLSDLERVKLVELRRAFELVSVRDAILCVVGWRVGRELLHAAARPKPKT
jgi:hypothetical protein